MTGSMKMIEEYLDELYPNPRCELNYTKDYELLLATMLSAQTTDKRVNEVTKVLFKKYPTLKALATANIKDIQDIISMMPGSIGRQLKNIQVDEKEFSRMEAIIKSMTKEERIKPEIINASRKRRIAAGSGTQVQEVNRLLKKFAETQKMMKMASNQAAAMGKKGKKKSFFKLPF